MELTINIPGLDNLATAIAKLAEVQQCALGGAAGSSYAPPVAPVAPVAPPAPPVAPAYAPPAPPVAPQPAYAPPAPPVAPQPAYAPPAPPVAPPPTAPATYTRQQLALAATGLVDAGKKADLVALLAQFQVPSLTALPEQSFGHFATALRQLGAAI